MAAKACPFQLHSDQSRCGPGRSYGCCRHLAGRRLARDMETEFDGALWSAALANANSKRTQSRQLGERMGSWLWHTGLGTRTSGQYRQAQALQNHTPKSWDWLKKKITRFKKKITLQYFFCDFWCTQVRFTSFSLQLGWLETYSFKWQLSLTSSHDSWSWDLAKNATTTTQVQTSCAPFYAITQLRILFGSELVAHSRVKALERWRN